MAAFGKRWTGKSNAVQYIQRANPVSQQCHAGRGTTRLKLRKANMPKRCRKTSSASPKRSGSMLRNYDKYIDSARLLYKVGSDICSSCLIPDAVNPSTSGEKLVRPAGKCNHGGFDDIRIIASMRWGKNRWELDQRIHLRSNEDSH